MIEQNTISTTDLHLLPLALLLHVTDKLLHPFSVFLITSAWLPYSKTPFPNHIDGPSRAVVIALSPFISLMFFGPLFRRVHIHLLLNKLQPPIHRRLRLRLLLLQQHGSDQLVDGGVVGQGVEFFAHGEVFLLLGFEALAGGDLGLEI